MITLAFTPEQAAAVGVVVSLTMRALQYGLWLVFPDLSRQTTDVPRWVSASTAFVYGTGVLLLGSAYLW